MIVVQTFTKGSGRFAGQSIAIDFEDCKRRLRLYFKNVGKIKAMLYAGQVVSMPCVKIRKDRRCRDIAVLDERRKPVNKSII